MKVVDHETSKEENQKWGNIARIRAIDPDFNAVIETLEKEANEKIEVKKVEVEGLMRDVNREYKKEVSKIESQYMKEKQEIDEKHRNKVLEQYEVWIQKKHGNSIYKKLKEQRYFISLRQYLISKWLEEKGVDWDPFEEEKSDEKLREDYNIEAEVVLDDAIKPLRERLYRILDILLGKVISLQEGILKVRNILSINKEIQLTRAVKDFFDPSKNRRNLLCPQMLKPCFLSVRPLGMALAASLWMRLQVVKPWNWLVWIGRSKAATSTPAIVL